MRKAFAAPPAPKRSHHAKPKPLVADGTWSVGAGGRRGAQRRSFTDLLAVNPQGVVCGGGAVGGGAQLLNVSNFLMCG